MLHVNQQTYRSKVSVVYVCYLQITLKKTKQHFQVFFHPFEKDQQTAMLEQVSS